MTTDKTKWKVTRDGKPVVGKTLFDHFMFQMTDMTHQRLDAVAGMNESELTRLTPEEAALLPEVIKALADTIDFGEAKVDSEEWLLDRLHEPQFAARMKCLLHSLHKNITSFADVMEGFDMVCTYKMEGPKKRKGDA